MPDSGRSVDRNRGHLPCAGRMRFSTPTAWEYCFSCIRISARRKSVRSAGRCSSSSLFDDFSSLIDPVLAQAVFGQHPEHGQIVGMDFQAFFQRSAASGSRSA